MSERKARAVPCLQVGQERQHPGGVARRLVMPRIPSSVGHVEACARRVRAPRATVATAIPAARGPALGQIAEIGERDRQTGLVQHGEDPLARPQHQGRATIGALERRPFVAGRLVELLLVRLHFLERIGRRELLRPRPETRPERTAAVGPPPFGQGHMPSKTSPASNSSSSARTTGRGANRIARVFRGAALLDGQQRQMQVAAGLWRGRDKHARDGGIGPFQRLEAELGRRVGVLQGIDQLFGRSSSGRSLAGGPGLQQRRRFACSRS